MSHDLYLLSNTDEFSLVGSPDADDIGLGRDKVFGGNAGIVVEWYAQYCRNLGWDADVWEASGANLASSCLADNDYYTSPPEWASPDPVARHIAMVNAFLAFAPGAKFVAS